MSFLSRLVLALLALRLVRRPRRRPNPVAVAALVASRAEAPSAFPWAVLASAGLAVALILGGVGVWRGARAAAQRLDVAKALTGGDPTRAPAAIRRYGCGGCHFIAGIAGADGKAASPLTDMRGRLFIGGVLRNNGENLIRWIVEPPAFSPRTAMPVTGIGEAEARDVAAYLYAR